MEISPPELLPAISPLPTYLVDQIKAGEVVEGPSSLLKELVENSLDAGATKISIIIRGVGLELISIQDNGHGMRLEDLPWAFRRHATSKITQFSDLYRLQTFGFRGEALASIASVSRIVCYSHPKQPHAQGGQISIHGGQEISLLPWRGDIHGTTISIQDLFFNTPARLKFIRSQVGEKNALKRVINASLLAHHRVTFSIQWDDKEKMIFAATASIQERIQEVLGGKNRPWSSDILAAEKFYEGYQISAYFGATTAGGGNQNKSQFLFINGRSFIDKSFHQMLANHLVPMWPPKTSGSYVLFLSAPPEHIDVNCHPSKMKIKFARPAIIYSLLQEVAGNILRQFQHLTHTSKTDLLPPVQNLPLDISTAQTPSNADFLLLLPGEFFFHRYQGDWWLVDLQQCLGEIFPVILEFNTDEPSNIPLLVGIPLPNLMPGIEKHLETLEKMGLHLDLTENNFWILRSLPLGLENFPYQRWIVPWLQDVSKWPQETQWQQYLLHFIAIANKSLLDWPNQQQWENLLNQFFLKVPHLKLMGRKKINREILQDLFP